jgi:hypothetical protein
MLNAAYLEKIKDAKELSLHVKFLA